MVDSTTGIGQIQGISSTNRTQNAQEKRADETERNEALRDSVEISEEAQELANAQQAEQEALNARRALEEDDTQTLGLNPGFDEDV